MPITSLTTPADLARMFREKPEGILSRANMNKVIFSLVPDALRALEAALSADDANGSPYWPGRIAAAKTILSRAGYGETAKLQIEQPDDEDLSALTKQQLADELEKLSQQLRMSAAVDVSPDRAVIDVESVHDERANERMDVDVPSATM